MNYNLNIRKRGRALSVLFFFMMFVGAYAQSVSDMQRTVEYLASPELEGRYPGSKGDTLASQYIVNQLIQLGLQPIHCGNGLLPSAYYHDFSYTPMRMGHGAEVPATNAVHSHNIVAVLPGNDPRFEGQYVVIGAHFDHLGYGGQGSGSRRPDTNAVHPGADDNASGVAMVLHLARHFTQTGSPRSLIFAFFGAEEQGLVGSKHLLDWLKTEDRSRCHLPDSLHAMITMINFDMVGRLRNNSISVSGTGTSAIAQALVDSAARRTALSAQCSPDGFGPSDHASFCAQDIPVFYLTTGGHLDYHTPADKPETVNYRGMDSVAAFAKVLISEIAALPQPPQFVNVPSSNRERMHPQFKVTLGLMPDVTGGSGQPGLRADIVVSGKPAYEAGIRSGDIILEVDGKPVGDIEEYMQRLSELTPDTTIPVKVKRGDQEIVFNVHLRPIQK